MIRPVCLQDWPAVYAIYRWYVENTNWNFEWEPQSLAAFVQSQQAFLQDYPYYVAEHAGKIIGYGLAHAAFSRISYQFDAELTIYFQPGPHYGLPRLMLEQICDDLRRQNVHWLIGCITAENDVSIRFHKNNGFVFQGELPQAGWKNGAFHGVVWYGREICPASWYTSAPRRFIPYTQLTQLPAAKSSAP